MKEDKENKTYTVEYKIDIPVVIFTYKEKKDNKEVVFERRFAYNSMFEKFGIKKEESDETNPEKIVQALEKCFSEKKVSLEVFKKTEYALEFKENSNSIFFKAFLEPTLQCNEVKFKENPDQKGNIQWEINIPKVIFSYTDEYGVIFEYALDYNCMFEKFGIKQKEEDKKNGMTLKGTISSYFYQNRVTLERFQQNKYYQIEFTEEGGQNLFKITLKPKMNVNVLSMKEKPEMKFNIEWVVDIPNVIFTYKEMKDGKEIIYRKEFDYSCMFEKFNIKKEENDEKNPQRLTNTIKKYFEEGKANVQEYKEGHTVYYRIEFLEDGNKTLFQVFLKY